MRDPATIDRVEPLTGMTISSTDVMWLARHTGRGVEFEADVPAVRKVTLTLADGGTITIEAEQGSPMDDDTPTLSVVYQP